MAIALAIALLLVLLLAPWLLLFAGAPLWVPLAIDVAVLACAAGVALARWLMQRSRAKAIERATAPRPPRDALAPDKAAELEELRRELDAAFGAIARSKLGGGGRAALVALPWYALVGAPSSGKSTLLRTSGVPFPSAPQLARSAAGASQLVGGTKRCDVWLGNDAVLLDTSGRWAIADDDAEWSAFLERLGKHRGARALDGVLLTIAIDEIVRATESERAAMARHLRARIESVAQRLGVAVPVYVMITKCDRLVGFSEAFAALDKRGRMRPWGFTLERETAAVSLDERVRGELDVLAAALRARSLSTLANERRVEARALAAELPAHFEHAFDPIANVLAQIFVASVYGETPTLRGVYFTSATQEGRPVDGLLDAAARASGVEARALAEPTLEPRSYFVHQVLTRIVFADAENAAPSTRARRRRALAHASLGVALATVASVLVVASAFSWQGNRRAVDRVASAVDALPHERELVTPDALAPLRDALTGLRAQVALGPPLTMRFGLYDGVRLSDVARRRYVAALREGVLTPLLASEASELESWGAVFETELDREPSAEERLRASVLVERQLRFADPPEPAEPALDARGRATMASALAEAWCGALRRPPADCERDAGLLLDVTDAGNRPRLPRQDRAIRLARLGLGRTRTDRAALDALVDAAHGRGYDLTLTRMVGTTGRALTSDHHVRGAFTRRGWEEVVRARIDATEGDAVRAWVLGSGPAARSTPASRELLRRAYFEAYAEEWRTFLASIHVTSAADATASLALLEDLTRGTPPPIGRLLQAVDDNAHLEDAREASPESAQTGLLASLTTHLTSARPEAAAAPTTSAASSPADAVARALEPYTRFAVRTEGEGEDAPLGVDVYGDELALLRDALATYRDDASSAGALETRLTAARRRVDGLVAEQAPGTRDFFERILRPPVEAAAVTSSHAMASSVASGFCATVVTPYAASIAGRYPFAPRGDDAPLGEVAAFYRPGGTLWSYYDASLATIAPRAGSRFELARRVSHEGSSPYSSSLPTFLQRSQAITSGLFPPGSTEPRIELDVRIHPTAGAASVRLSVGGATIDYRNGPETWTRIVWPGATPSAGARLEVESARGLSERITQDGEWGLFRLVEAAVQLDARPGERTHTARWHLPGHDVDVVVDLRSVRTECALFGDDHHGRALGPLRAAGVSAPRRIARAGSECAP